MKRLYYCSKHRYQPLFETQDNRLHCKWCADRGTYSKEECMSVEAFELGSKVVIKHQRELGEFEVTQEFEILPEQITLSDGKQVDGYVRLGPDRLGYHIDNLEIV